MTRKARWSAKKEQKSRKAAQTPIGGFPFLQTRSSPFAPSTFDGKRHNVSHRFRTPISKAFIALPMRPDPAITHFSVITFFWGVSSIVPVGRSGRARRKTRGPPLSLDGRTHFRKRVSRVPRKHRIDDIGEAENFVSQKRGMTRPSRVIWRRVRPSDAQKYPISSVGRGGRPGRRRSRGPPVPDSTQSRISFPDREREDVDGEGEFDKRFAREIGSIPLQWSSFHRRIASRMESHPRIERMLPRVSLNYMFRKIFESHSRIDRFF